MSVIRLRTLEVYISVYISDSDLLVAGS